MPYLQKKTTKNYYISRKKMFLLNLNLNYVQH